MPCAARRGRIVGAQRRRTTRVVRRLENDRSVPIQIELEQRPRAIGSKIELCEMQDSPAA